MRDVDTRWVYEIKSTVKGHEGEVVAYEVKVRDPDGNATSKCFSAKKYRTLKQALKNAITYRDDMLYRKRNHMLEQEKKKKIYTVEAMSLS